MTLPNIFATTPGGSARHAADLDTNFQAVGLLGIIPCSASGTNAITLTPAANMPTISAYQNNLTLGFVTAGASTGAVTLGTLGLPLLPVYLQDGVTQAASGSLTANTFYIVSYVSAYNGGSGGWSMTGNQPAASPDFSLLTLTDNPADTAFVAGTIGAGPSNNRKFRPGEVGGWCALAELVAAGSANLSFNFSTFITDFEDFEFIGSYIANGTDATDLWCRTSADGTTFDSAAASYSWENQEQTSGGTGAAGSASDTKIQINSADSMGNAANEACCFRLTIYNAGQSAVHTQLSYTGHMISSIPRNVPFYGGGRRLSAAQVKGLQFLPSSGVIATGKITMMGRRKVT